jgi:hypothetical protein
MNDTEKMLLALVVVAIILLIALYVRNRRHKEGMGSPYTKCTEKCRGLSGDARIHCGDDCWDATSKDYRMDLINRGWTGDLVLRR